MASGKRDRGLGEAQARVGHAVARKLGMVDLSDLGLTELPESIVQLADVWRLNLSGNQLSVLPDWLGQLTQLEVLGLRGNQLGVLPDWLGHLTQLQSLDLRENQLSMLPVGLAQLTQLQYLGLRGNQLSVLPDWLGQLTQLQYLDLSGNQLSALPDWLGQLTHLQTLDLSRMQLSVLPDRLGQLTQLERLDLSGNQLRVLPDWLGQFTQLQDLGLGGNPLLAEFDEAYKQGTERLLAYLRERAESTVTFWQAKVMLVGEGGHGKTCVLRALRGEEFVEGHLATPLLDVKDLRMRHPDGEAEMDLRVWDFGGQDFYFATQQFFFTGKSIFLLVWNPRGNFQKGTITDWLDRIQALAPDAPVILVATHGESHDPNVPLAQLREKYRNIAGEVFSVDSRTGKNVERLRQAIGAAAAGLDHMGVRRPAAWVRATEAVQRHPDNYVEVGKFKEMAAALGVKEVDGLLAQLSLSGELTFFSENPIYHPETAELNDWVILKPAWLLQRISGVLTDEATRKVASFAKKDLERVWPESPCFVREFLARLMEHFDLAYHVDDGSGRHMVVELAPEDRPADVAPRWNAWGEGEVIKRVALQYRFPIAIPPGLPTWFTARAHRYTTPERHWRGGALLTDGQGNAALVERDLDHRSVRIEARGPLPVEFFTKLRICFDDTISRFPGLKELVQEIAPCVKPGCPGFNRRTLELDMQEGLREIRCQASDCRQKHQIAELLYGLSLGNVGEQIARLQQEFNLLTAREQSQLAARCPSLFTLEYDRLPALLPTESEGLWAHLTDKPVAARLTLFCQHPGDCHSVEEYRIQAPGRRLAQLAPLLKMAQPILQAAKVTDVKDLAEAWTDNLSEPLGLLEETGEDPQLACGTALVALRQILMEVAPGEADRWGGLQQVLLLKSQYLWVCDKHAKHKDYQA